MPAHTPRAVTIALSGVRALSIRQPWASLILRHGKVVENRTWRVRWRGLLVVHAGQRWHERGRAVATELGIDVGRDEPTGYLGVVELIGCRLDRGCCRPWGEPGAYHFQLHAPRPFPTPIPGPGQRGLYRALPPAVAEAVTATSTVTAPPSERTL